MRTYEYLVLHHSLTSDNVLLADSIAIRKYHMETNGWADIGYHYVIEKVAGIVTTSVGRPLQNSGAHCIEAGMNEKSIGICVVGNFDETLPSLDLTKYVAQLCMAFMVNYNIPAWKVIGHRDAGMMAGFDWRRIGSTGIREFKTCPGILWPEAMLQSMLNGTYRI